MTTPDPVVREDPLPDAETVTAVQELAFFTMHAALRRDGDIFAASYNGLIEKHFPCLSIAFGVWCDEAIKAIEAISPDEHRRAGLLRSVYRMENERGDGAQWGARILKARADDDKDAYLAALAEFNALPAVDKARHIPALLGGTVTAIAATHRVTETAVADFRG